MASHTILLAEDEPLLAMALADGLEMEGHRVALAADGAAALAEARRLGDGLGALVTDLGMPRLGGADLIRALRAARPALPVVVVTGSPPPGGVEELRRRGGGHGPLVLLPKPLADPALVAEALRLILSSAPSAPPTGAPAGAAPPRRQTSGLPPRRPGSVPGPPAPAGVGRPGLARPGRAGS
jgi:CheY-like chemotaxis protein